MWDPCGRGPSWAVRTRRFGRGSVDCRLFLVQRWIGVRRESLGGDVGLGQFGVEIWGAEGSIEEDKTGVQIGLQLVRTLQATNCSE